MFRVDLHMCFRALGLRMLTEMSGKKQTRNMSVSLIRRMAWLGPSLFLLTGFTSHWERVAGSSAETVSECFHCPSVLSFASDTLKLGF